MAEKKSDRLGKRVADLDERVASLAREQRRLSHILNIRGNWNSEIKNWIGLQIQVYLTDGETSLEGRLKWTDKHHIAIVPQGREEDDPMVINKGAVSFLERSKEGRGW